MLPPIPELHFDEEAHRYQYDGKWLPLSPTQVLSFDMDEEAKQRINETKEGPDGWEIRGNTLHGCLEQFLLGAAELDPKQFGEWWEPLRNCWLWEDVKIMGVELRMTDKKRIGGSCDFLIKQKDGTVVLGDLEDGQQPEGSGQAQAGNRTAGCVPVLDEQELPKGDGGQGGYGHRRSRQDKGDPRRPSGGVDSVGRRHVPLPGTPRSERWASDGLLGSLLL